MQGKSHECRILKLMTTIYLHCNNNSAGWGLNLIRCSVATSPSQDSQKPVPQYLENWDNCSSWEYPKQCALQLPSSPLTYWAVRLPEWSKYVYKRLVNPELVQTWKINSKTIPKACLQRGKWIMATFEHPTHHTKWHFLTLGSIKQSNRRKNWSRDLVLPMMMMIAFITIKISLVPLI